MNNNNSNHFDPFQNWGNQNQASQQKRLQNQKIKQGYKSKAEDGLDNMISEYNQAKINQVVDWNPSSKDKAQITRYFKRYWDNNFFIYAVIIAIITFITSFYTTFAVGGIVAVFVLKLTLSQNIFMKYFLNDHQIEKEDMVYLKNKIFGKQLNVLTTFMITVVLTMISFTMSFYTIGIYIDVEKIPFLSNLLSKWYPFIPDNELFAYTNIFSIFILILLKVIEKWR
ncbi:hypothetical protein Abu_1711 [Aliarcobacter butzleri RM4018]|uniref:Uncharacterized protein n=1 Tax=Aliarcobacter butzleri (strain RM4018) TaxID=367737 RepID=A8EVI5_ALIB4|nr:hypothetical protein [Aliarcobacter butzleri]ABV67958.1 hypothetical protein Abu_1711 [Aliarcobacter butzleri RM4018]GGT78708.1 hypothetical protein GCM10007985_13950 [Aliarcobacter butzleri]SNV31343.1 Uncharacterised protein [Aliarcobacter butzleri]